MKVCKQGLQQQVNIDDESNNIKVKEKGIRQKEP